MTHCGPCPAVPGSVNTTTGVPKKEISLLLICSNMFWNAHLKLGNHRHGFMFEPFENFETIVWLWHAKHPFTYSTAWLHTSEKLLKRLMKSNCCPTWISDILLQRFSTQCVHSRALNLGISPFTCRSERPLADVSTLSQPVLGRWRSQSQEKWWAPFIFNLQANHFRDNWGGRWHGEEKFENCLIILLSNQETHQKVRKSWGNYYSVGTSYNWSGTVCSWRWLSFLQTTLVYEGKASGQDLKQQFKSTEDT